MLDAAAYSSQFGQDRLLDTMLFEGMRDGVFLDVGANDGIKFSNTLFFERTRGWSGLCIEADPASFDALAKNGRTAECLNIGVGVADATLPFLQVDGYHQMLSGLLATADMKAVDKAIRRNGGTKRIIDVPVRRLGDVLAERSIREVHYLSLDIEGGEANVLRGVDFSRVMLHVATIECSSPKNLAAARSLTADAFEAVGMIEGDLLVVNRRSGVSQKVGLLAKHLADEHLRRVEAIETDREQRNKGLRGLIVRPLMHLGRQASRW